MPTTSPHESHLTYLSAADVRSPLGYLGGFEMRGQDNEPIGRVAGVLIDSELQRLRYLVVAAPGGAGRCRLVDTDEIVCLDPVRHSLRVSTPGESVRTEFDLDWVSFLAPPVLSHDLVD
jgi:hypothetical protein